ncbi:MAG: acetate--CoA ligase family protein, partial [Solirubrobacterales bacterium]|nr:acetate--CoA ligase family protein [Solirubrobacterales bacterium]
ETPELVIIAVAAEDVLAVAADAAQKGARALIVLSEGFAETGDGGREREEQLLELVRSAGMRLVGPNSLGVINTDPQVSLNTTVAGAQVSEGRLAVCSQSGAIGLGLLGHAAARHLGISSFASLGNRADVSTNDLLEYWEEDERTAAVMLYVQTFGNPERFTRIARRVSQRKPILVVKGLRMETMRVEARSHTAAAQHGDAVVDALLRHAGVLRFRSGDELFNAAQFFESQPLPLGRRVGVVSNSYGVGTLAVDACVARGLEAPPLNESTVERLGNGGPVTNPLTLDIYSDAAAYGTAIEAMLADEGVDAVMAFYVDLAGGDPSAVLTTINATAEGGVKPVVTSVVTAEGRLPEAESGGVPNFLFPEACAGVLARAAERREWLSRPLGARPRYSDLDPEGARARLSADAGWLPTPEAQALLATHGIPFVTSEACDDVERAVSAAESLGGPVVLKADFPPPGHAGDVDAVLLGLDGATAIRAGWSELERRVDAAGREWAGAVVQPLVPPGADVLVGAIADPELGPVMALGLGGRQAGLAGDVGFRLLPATDVDADELLVASRSVAMQLDGFRGSPILDRDALRELILRFALLLREVPEIVEADLNPVRAMATGAIVLDMRLSLEHRRRFEAVKTW